MLRSQIHRKTISILLALSVVFGMVTSLGVNASARTIHPLTVVAGTGTSGYFGDGGSALSAQLNLTDESGVAVDSDGNVYIADSNNHRIRKVDHSTGNISTIFDFGTRFGDAYFNNFIPYGITTGPDGNIYFSDNLVKQIWEYDRSSGTVNFCVGVNSNPFGIAFGPDGCLYIAESNAHCIEKWDPSTKALTTAVGQAGNYGYVNVGAVKDSGAACLNQPVDVTFDPSNNDMLIADCQAARLYKVDHATGQVSVFAGGGSFAGVGKAATQTELSYPESVRVDSDGNVYCTENFDANFYYVLRVDPSDHKVYAFAGTGKYGKISNNAEATDAAIGGTLGLAVDQDDTVYFSGYGYVAKVETKQQTDPTVVDSGHNTVSVSPSIVQKGSAVTIRAVGDGQTDATETDGSERYIAADWSSSDGQSGIFEGGAMTASYTPSRTGGISVQIQYRKQVYSGGVWTDAPASETYVTDQKTVGLVVAEDDKVYNIAGLNSAVGYSGDGGPATNAALAISSGIAFDSRGILYVADSLNDVIRKIDTDGVISTIAGGGTSTANAGKATDIALKDPQGISVDSTGNILIADSMNGKIRKVDVNGNLTTIAGTGTAGFSGDGGPAAQADLVNPTAVTEDSQGNIFIADNGNHRVRRIDAQTKIISTVIGDTEGYMGDGPVSEHNALFSATDVKCDKNGALYIADEEGSAVFRVDFKTDGSPNTVTTVAGRPSYRGFGGDGNPATSATLYYPSRIALDSSGNVYICDEGNHRIRKVYTNGIITTFAGGGTSYTEGGSMTQQLIDDPTAIAVDSYGDAYYAQIKTSDTMQLLNSNVRRIIISNRLPSPANLQWDGKTAKWGAVQNASGYEAVLKKNGVDYGAKIAVNSGTQFDFSQMIAASGAGKYTFTVKAKGDGQTTSDSPGVTVAAFCGQLSAPSNPVWAGQAAKWGAVPNASGYSVLLLKDGQACGAAVTVTSGTQYDFSARIASAGYGVYTFTVKALGNANLSDSTASLSAGYSYSAPTSDSSTSSPTLPTAVTDSLTNAAAVISGASFPADVTSVSLSITPVVTAATSGATAGGSSGSTPGNTPGGTPDPQAAAAYNLAVSSADLNLIGTPLLYNIKLLDQNGTPISTFTGTVTVKIPVPAGIHGTPHVFRYEENTGTFTDLGAVVQDGFLVFSTTHFSYYIVAGAGDSISLDTKSYQMPVGGSYQIGVKLTGAKAASVKITSTNDKVASAVRLKNGNVSVTGKGPGTAYIMFDVYDNKNHLLTHASVRVDVKTGIRPRGDSTRQIGVF
jgi:sugar lactone lactonase YvrE